MNTLYIEQDANRVLPEGEAASYCGVPISSWRKMRRRDETPPAIQLSPRRRGYTLGSLIDWQQNRTTTNAGSLMMNSIFHFAIMLNGVG